MKNWRKGKDETHQPYNETDDITLGRRSLKYRLQSRKKTYFPAFLFGLLRVFVPVRLSFASSLICKSISLFTATNIFTIYREF